MPFGYPAPPIPTSLLVARRLRHPHACRMFRAPDASMESAGIPCGLLLVVCTETPRAPNSLVLASFAGRLVVRRLIMQKTVPRLVSLPWEGEESETVDLAGDGVEVLAVVVDALVMDARRTGLRWWPGCAEV